MYNLRVLTDTVRLTAPCAVTCALAFGYQPGLKRLQPNEKQLIIHTLNRIDGQLSFFAHNPRLHFQSFDGSISRILDHTRWFRSKAKDWRPKTTVEGQPLRKSLQLILAALRTIDAATPRTAELMQQIEDDLGAKVNFCKALGLSTMAVVIVTTKRDGLTEVKGLEVSYIEKFLTSDRQ